jgi:urea transporter
MMRSPLAGIGQIYFQASPWYGGLLLGCLYLMAPPMAAGCLLGVCAASGTAWALAFPVRERKAGVYGFNGALSGAGLCVAWQFNVALLCWITLAGILTALLARAMERHKLPPLTFLFVLVMWAAAALGPAFGLEPLPAGAAPACTLAPLSYVFCTFGQASFAAATPVGLLLLVALAKVRWQWGAWAAGGAAMAWSALGLAGQVAPAGQVAQLGAAAGVNCSLVALGLSVRECDWRWRCVGAAVCFALCVAGVGLGRALYTLPFVLSVWLVLAARRAI